jgi:hypothetical protein
MGSLTTNMRVDLQNEGFTDIRIALLSPGVVATDFGLNAVRRPPPLLLRPASSHSFIMKLSAPCRTVY